MIARKSEVACSHGRPLQLMLELAVMVAAMSGVQRVFAADPLPANRRIDWSYTGVPGGIPIRTNICASFTPATGTASAINAAISACNNGVVYLGAGSYNVQGIQVYNSNVTLRGAGADQTILKGSNVMALGSGGNSSLGTAIVGGAAKDSRTFTVTSTSGLSVGQMIDIDRNDDPSIPAVSTTGTTRVMNQMNVITAISGTTVTVRNPFFWDFGAAAGGKVKYTFTNTRNSGVEDLKIDHTGFTGSSFNITYCDGCWLKGIESSNADAYHFTVLGTVNNEYRDSLVHLAPSGGNNHGGFSVYGNPTYGYNSTGKIENDIFDQVGPAVELQNSDSGFYIGYNFFYGSSAQQGSFIVTWTMEDNHGPEDVMNLWEGNIGEMFGSDGYYGGSAFGTAFRNHILGLNRDDSSHSASEPIRLNRLAYGYNIIGNILGSSVAAAPGFNIYAQTSEGCSSGTGIYRLGYPNIGNCSLTDVTGYAVPGGMTYPDAKVTTTLLRWGNYDYFSKSVQFNSTEIPSSVPVPADQLLPNSYYYPSRPAWFNTGVPWPPIGPDVTGGAAFGDTSGHVNDIPASLCWNQRNLVGGGSFNAATCYPLSALAGPPPPPSPAPGLAPPANIRVVP